MRYQPPSPLRARPFVPRRPELSRESPLRYQASLPSPPLPTPSLSPASPAADMPSQHAGGGWRKHESRAFLSYFPRIFRRDRRKTAGHQSSPRLRTRDGARDVVGKSETSTSSPASEGTTTTTTTTTDERTRAVIALPLAIACDYDTRGWEGRDRVAPLFRRAN